jgi:hypothetical protein
VGSISSDCGVADLIKGLAVNIQTPCFEKAGECIHID